MKGSKEGTNSEDECVTSVLNFLLPENSQTRDTDQSGTINSYEMRNAVNDAGMGWPGWIGGGRSGERGGLGHWGLPKG